MRRFAALVVVVLAAVAGALSSSPASAVSACGRAGYSYAGFQAAAPAHGVRADIVALGIPHVESGHVAAWVGVGGPGQGTGGSDAWIQVGFSAFQTGETNIYFETNRPGVGPRYTRVLDGVDSGTRHRLAVLEVTRHPGWWRVWVDGKPVSEPVFLAGSNGRWRPIATAETWDGGRRVCNLFSYKFGRVTVAGPRGAWRRFHSGFRFQDPGYKVLGSRNGFVTRGIRPLPKPSTVKAGPGEPPASQPTAPPADATVAPTAEPPAAPAENSAG